MLAIVVHENLNGETKIKGFNIKSSYRCYLQTMVIKTVSDPFFV